MDNNRNWQPFHFDGGSGSVGAYSPAAIAGNTLYISGQVPLDPATGEVLGDRPFADQARLTLQNLKRVVEAAGSNLANVVQVTVYLADHGDWAEFNDIYQEFFTTPYPARAVVGAELSGFSVEATAVAVLPPS